MNQIVLQAASQANGNMIRKGTHCRTDGIATGAAHGLLVGSGVVGKWPQLVDTLLPVTWP